jgi:hypothetical protein
MSDAPRPGKKVGLTRRALLALAGSYALKRTTGSDAVLAGSAPPPTVSGRRFQRLAMQGPDPGQQLPSWMQRAGNAGYNLIAQHIDLFLVHGFDQFRAREMKQHQRDIDPTHVCKIIRYETTERFSNDGTVSYAPRLAELPNQAALTSDGGTWVGGKSIGDDRPIDISRTDVLNVVKAGVLADLNAVGTSGLDGVFNDTEYLITISDGGQGWNPFPSRHNPTAAQIANWARPVQGAAWTRRYLSSLIAHLRASGYPLFWGNTASIFAGFPDDSQLVFNYDTIGPCAVIYDLFDGSMMEHAFHHDNRQAGEPSYDDKTLQRQISSIRQRIDLGKGVWCFMGFDGGASTQTAIHNLVAWGFGLAMCLSDGVHLYYEPGYFGHRQEVFQYAIQNIGQPVPSPAGARENRNRDGNYDRTFTHARFIVNDSQTRSRPNTTGVGPSILPRMTAFNQFF